MLEIITQLPSPIWIFILMLINSVPFVGLFLPEELILTYAFIEENSPVVTLLIYLSSIFGMVTGQMTLFFLSRKYRFSIFSIFKIKKVQYESIVTFLTKASHLDHVLLRISTNSLFRVVAAIGSGVQGMPTRVGFLYEIISATIKTSIFFALGYLSKRILPESILENTILALGIILLVTTLISFTFSYQIKQKVKP